jgi:hypothetical protein
MDIDTFRKSLSGSEPPEGLDSRLTALWHAAKGDWKKAHALVKDDASAAGAHIHAYLHRTEGDHSNAEYWYRQAGKKPASGSPENEWSEIAAGLLLGPSN